MYVYHRGYIDARILTCTKVIQYMRIFRINDGFIAKGENEMLEFIKFYSTVYRFITLCQFISVMK